MRIVIGRRPAMLLLLLMGCVLTGGVVADEYHFINTFVGDRAAGMGGAYTAIADGPEGMYYNPAGLAFAPTNYVSVSTNAFEVRNSTYEDLAGTGVDFSRSSFALVPNFFGFVQRADKGVWGFTIFSPDSLSVNLRDTLLFEELTDEDGRPFVQQRTLLQDISYNISEVGPAAGTLVGDRLGVGGALFAGYIQTERLDRETDRFFYTDTNPVEFSGQTQLNRTTDTSTFTIRPQAGVQYIPHDAVSIGFSTTLRLPVYQSVGQAESNQGGGSIEFPLYTTTTRSIFADGIFASTAIENRLGVAWFASRQLIVAGDVMAYVPINPDGTPAKDERQFTWNAAMGMEYYIGQNFPVRFGIFTNNANTRAPETGVTGQPEHVDLYGATASVGFATANITLSLGGMYSYGIGESQLVGGSDDIQTLRTRSASVFVSGGYLF